LEKQYCIILTTTDKKEMAYKIAHKLLEMNLAACVQFDKITSFFKWEGKTSEVKEIRLIIKAKSDNYKNIEKVISSIHNYKIPQIVKLNISEGLPAYLDWLNS
jgi:periplasmic divalent cation tolerance protein